MLLICGGLLGFLPIMGLWMLPLGLLLLAEDVPPLKSARTRILDWVERRHPNWLAPQGLSSGLSIHAPIPCTAFPPICLMAVTLLIFVSSQQKAPQERMPYWKSN
jgi:hypothetical protein